MKIIALGGVPCAGKTTLMKSYRAKYLSNKPKLLKWKSLRLEYHEEQKVFVLGVYNEGLGVFQGTDKLSMSVQPNAISFMRQANVVFSDHTVIFEGDRLFNLKFLQFCQLIAGPDNVSIVVLKPNLATLVQRQNQRGNKQSDIFLRSRKTKIINIADSISCLELISESKLLVDDFHLIINK